MLTVISMPTPEGYAGIYFRARTGLANLFAREQQTLLDYVFLTMEGSPTRWQSYLAVKGIQPKIFDSLHLEISGQQRMRFQSPRFELELTPELIKLSDNTSVRLNFAFFRAGDTVVWDVAGLYATENRNSQNRLLVWRNTEPSGDLPQGFQSDWHNMVSHEFPYNASLSTENGATNIKTVAPGPGAAAGARIHYALRVDAQGSQPQDVMKRKLDLLQRAFEHHEQ